VVETGFSSGVLTDQADTGHAARLRALAAKQAPTAPDPVQQAQQAAKSGAPDAALDLGIAYFNAGNHAAAVQNIAPLATSSATPDGALAQLWLIYVNGKVSEARNGA